MPEFIGDDEEARSGGLAADSTPRLLLSQLRWLDFVQDSEALTTKLLECLQVSPKHIQRELVSFIPEIVDDSQHAVSGGRCVLVPIPRAWL